MSGRIRSEEADFPLSIHEPGPRLHSIQSSKSASLVVRQTRLA